MVYFNELLGNAIIDQNNKHIGTLKDLVFIDGEEYAEISHLIYIGNDHYRKKISWRFVKELKDDFTTKKIDINLHLNVPLEESNPSFEHGDEFLVSSLIDKQIVDVTGLRIVRVNDIILGKVENKFCVVAVCVGKRSFIRRLGLEWMTKMFVPRLNDYCIPWKSVEPLEQGIQNLHIKTRKSKLAALHPSEIADLMEDLSLNQRALIFRSLDEEKATITLTKANPAVQESFLRNLQTNKVVEILEDMTPNQAADLLALMPKRRADALLSLMREDSTKKIKEILKYPEESAGAIMKPDFIAIPKELTAQQTIEHIRKIKPHSERIYHLYVVDKENKLLGVLSIRALIAAQADETVAKIMKRDIAKVKLNTLKEDIAKTLSKYNLYVVPVTDENNILKGVVSADDLILDVMPSSWKRKRYSPVKKKK